MIGGSDANDESGLKIETRFAAAQAEGSCLAVCFAAVGSSSPAAVDSGRMSVVGNQLEAHHKLCLDTGPP